MYKQIITFQTAINLFGFGLSVDGIPGLKTSEAVRVMAQNLKHIRDLPADRQQTTETADDVRLMGGRASTFGGPRDTADYCEGQAYFPAAPRGMSPAGYYARVPMDVQAYLRAAMATAYVWPEVTDWRGEKRQAGVSYWLDPTARYIALRLTGDLHRRGKSGEPIMVRVISASDPSVSVIARVTDWGPSEYLEGKKVWADVDVSPGVYEALGLEYTGARDRVWIEILNDITKVEK